MICIESYLGCNYERRALSEVVVPRGARISTTTSTAKFINKGTKLYVDYKAFNEFLQKHTPLVSPVDTGAIITSSKIGKFAGQVTINVATNGRNVNIFLFHNGSVKCTGVDHPKTGVRALLALLEVCKVANVLSIPSLCRVQCYMTVNINSSFHLGYEVDRTVLFQILSTQYNLLSLFDPTQYPGVNTKFFYNEQNESQDGKCHCNDDNRSCVSKKGTGNTRHACRRITITVFRSGIIIFTGSRNYRQLKAVFDCITCICRRHIDEIRVPEFNLIPTDAQIKN